MFGPTVEQPDYRLRVIASRFAVDAVIVHSIDHFDGAVVPRELIAIVDVITVTPEHTFARWATGEMPAELDRA